MSTPLDKHGYVISESDGKSRRYRLILGFASLRDLQDAHEYVVKHCNCQGPTTEGYSSPDTRPAGEKEGNPGTTQIDLTAHQVSQILDFIDSEPSDLTLQSSNGNVYVWLTEYPRDGSQLLARGPDETPAALCDDCPPVGYPTNKTRCTPCPRRTPESEFAAPQEEK